MNKIILLILGLCFIVISNGCLVVGEGSITGYIFAIQEGITWNYVFVKTHLTSSENYAFLINKKNSNLYSELNKLSKINKKVTCKYLNHAFSASFFSQAQIIEVKINE